MDRRQFFRQAGALSAAQAASMGAGGAVRAAILGTQHSHTTGKLNAMRDSPDFEVAGVCENDPTARAKAQKDPRFQGLRWMSEEELLNDRSIQLVVVECWVWEALPWGKKVIAAGKHLHLEKPPGNEWAPFKALVEEARRKKLLLQTGYLWRWHAGVNAAIEAARNGWLGEVYLMRGSMNSDRGAEERVKEAKYRGGGFFELSGHVIDRTVDLLGRPKKVQSWLRHDTAAADKLADNNLAVLEYDKSIATIFQAARSPGTSEHRSFELIGTEGSVIVYPETSPPRMRVFVRKAQGPYKAGWQSIDLPPQPRFIADFKELGQAIKTGRPLKHSYDHELLLHETLLRASGEMG
jgi:predicted dehydrogenase